MLNIDQTLLRRIFLNLISNAIKFTEKGAITIAHRDTTLYHEFSIQDTGLGIQEDNQKVIFEKFHQVDYSSRRQYDGIGLGLSIVKQLVELHNGKVWVKSKYTKGSTFYFTLSKNKTSIPEKIESN